MKTKSEKAAASKKQRAVRDTVLDPTESNALRFLNDRVSTQVTRNILITGAALIRAVSVYAHEPRFRAAIGAVSELTKILCATRIKLTPRGEFLAALFLQPPNPSFGWLPVMGLGPNWYAPNLSCDEGRDLAQRIDGFMSIHGNYGLTLSVLRCMIVDASVIEPILDPGTNTLLNVHWFLTQDGKNFVLRFTVNDYHPATLAAYRSAMKKKRLPVIRHEVVRAIQVNDLCSHSGFKLGFKPGDTTVTEIPSWQADAMYFDNEERANASAIRKAVWTRAEGARPGKFNRNHSAPTNKS